MFQSVNSLRQGFWYSLFFTVLIVPAIALAPPWSEGGEAWKMELLNWTGNKTYFLAWAAGVLISGAKTIHVTIKKKK